MIALQTNSKMLKFCMALWKKILIILGVFLLVGIILMVVFYFMLKNFSLPSLPQGDYFLTKIELSNEEHLTVLEEFENKEYYFSVLEKNELISYSQDKGILENENGYFCALLENELAIFYNDENGDLAYSGRYYNGIATIMINDEQGTYIYTYVFEESLI